MVAEPVNAVTGKATVTPPVEGRPWASVSLRVCVKGTNSCREVPPAGCTLSGPANFTCTINGCAAETTYAVFATAVHADGTTSPESSPDDFTTPKHRWGASGPRPAPL